MAEEFIGSSVLVTLNQPEGVQVRGEVANIVHQELLLKNGE
jgi:hypothetical protein